MTTALGIILRSVWTPKKAPGLAAWYPNARSGAQWDDMSGNGRNLVQATGGFQPAFVAGALNGLGSLTFDGADDKMVTAAFSRPQPSMVYLLIKQVTWSLTDGFIDDLTPYNANMTTAIATPQIALYAGGPTSCNNSDAAVGVWLVMSIKFAGASSFIRVNNLAPTVGNPGANTASGFFIGGQNDGLGFWGNFSVAEVILRNADDDAGMQQKHINYLAKRGGLNI